MSIFETAWIVNCGHQTVIAQNRNFIVVSDSDLKKVFRMHLKN